MSTTRSQLALYHRSLGYFRSDKWVVFALCALIVTSVLLNLLAAWPMALLVDVVLSPQPHTSWIHKLFFAVLPASKPGQLVGLVLLGMLVKIVFDGVWMARMMINARLKLRGTQRVRSEVYDKLQSLGVAYHKAQSQGDTIYRVTTDSLGPWGVLDTFIGSAVAVLSLVGMTVVMLSRNVTLTLCALSVIPLLALANLHFGRTIRARSLDAKQADADLTTATQRAIGAMPIVIGFNQQQREAERFDIAQQRSVRENWRLAWQENLYAYSVQAIYAIGAAIILGYGGYLAYGNTFITPTAGGLSAGDLIVFMAYLTQLWDPLQWVIGFFAKVQPFPASAERIFRVLDARPEVIERPNAIALPVRPRSLSLKDVWFAYRDDVPVLQGVDVRIEPGQMVAFVGPSGSGKSTLLNLLARFHDPLEGAVLLDRYDLRQMRLADVRRHVALVMQDSPLFPVSIGENLAYGRPVAKHEEIHAAAVAAGVIDLIELLPDGYDTPVVEGAQNLSGGQRQRIAIARAIVTGAPILVLDEPTSALDPQHEQHVLRTLEALRGQRTIILVTHRIESAATCDQIFVMQAGQVVERGTHESLLAKGGLYARYVRRGNRGATKRGNTDRNSNS